MRDYKFRIYFRDDESFMSEPISLEDLLHEDWIEFENEEGTLSLPLKDFRFFYYKGSKAYEIMQYTGLKDKNGKEIYEGDIVGDKDIKWVVKWNIHRMGFSLYPTTEQLYDEMPVNVENKLGFEVIGNIWENGDLLNDSK